MIEIAISDFQTSRYFNQAKFWNSLKISPVDSLDFIKILILSSVFRYKNGQPLQLNCIVDFVAV